MWLSVGQSVGRSLAYLETGRAQKPPSLSSPLLFTARCHSSHEGGVGGRYAWRRKPSLALYYSAQNHDPLLHITTHASISRHRPKQNLTHTRLKSYHLISLSLCHAHTRTRTHSITSRPQLPEQVIRQVLHHRLARIAPDRLPQRLPALPLHHVNHILQPETKIAHPQHHRRPALRKRALALHRRVMRPWRPGEPHPGRVSAQPTMGRWRGLQLALRRDGCAGGGGGHLVILRVDLVVILVGRDRPALGWRGRGPVGSRP
mmetsp:Transcript_28190/g.81225  ORF Transcript_28190/g.81225 Transcript_28190/m.81225 type:complete len:260 (+) Transcript_28190:478-1257(+)